MSPKDKVRANVYKELLRQEKSKNKKLSVMSVGVFFVGIFATSTYNNLNTKPAINQNFVFEPAAIQQKNIHTENPTISSMFEEFISNDKSLDISPDEFFVVNNQI